MLYRILKILKSLPFILLFLVLSGCAHQNLMDDATDYLVQGRYELAVERYREALRLEPNNKETQRQLNQARQQLQTWLGKVKQAALQAQNERQQGKALILNAKLASLNHDQAALQNYNELYQNIKQKYQYQVVLSYPESLLGESLGYEIAGLQLVDQKSARANNRVNIQFSLSKPKTRIRETEQIITTQYVSGMETIANPDYLHLQDDISKQRYTLDDYHNKLTHLQKDQKTLQYHLTAMEKDLQIAELRLSRVPVNSQRYADLQMQIQHLNDDIAGQKNILFKNEKKIKKAEKRYYRADQRLSKLLDELSYLPPTAEQEVYRDYQYPQQTLKQTITSQLIMNIDGKTVQWPISLEESDQSHAAHPRIGLSRKKPNLQSRRHFELKLYQQARKVADAKLARQVAIYKQQILNSASQADSHNERFDLWIGSALAGAQGVNQDVARKIQQSLLLEFGQGGEWRINKLINLHQY